MEFRRLIDAAKKDLDKLLAAKSVKEYESVHTAAKPTFQAVEAKYTELAGTQLSKADLKTVGLASTEYDKLWNKVRNHRKALGDDPQPLEGGRKWKMPRKMTRRYCKKTSCRKMGFTQKASCRPWKNCY